MNSGFKFTGIFLYILINILDKYQYQSFRCYVCDYCPIVTNESVSRDDICTSCATGGTSYGVHRICVYNNSKPPINFPKENQVECKSELCNGATVIDASGTPQGPIEKPISCYSCLNCTKNNQEVKNMCGGCLTVTSSGLKHKYCGPTCDKVLNRVQVSCCSTSFCME
uniref:SJCHGC03008 protein n=1 Tax=Schistosoma japonicum TaxID=6182 RepID=Q5DF68_SCHJA|nr:SJCHGC03008 protein [Schistosoma japonicum]